MMFGTRKEFEYIECSNCGCLQIKDIPENIAEFYPDSYNAFDPPGRISKNRYLRYVQHKKIQHLLGENPNLIGWIISCIIKESFENKLVYTKIKSGDKILDVGSGSGARIIRLRQKGFTDITGTDIFIEKDYYYDEGLRILKKDIREIQDTYDFVMLNHVFEHMPEPLENLKILYQLVKPGKFLMVRIPVADSYSWKTYGTDWIGLDAPRHFHLHTRKSMKLMAEQVGFIFEKVIDDSSEYQFIGSEQYRKGIARNAEKSYFINPSISGYSRRDVAFFKKKARKLNQTDQGDASCFYLFKP